MRVEHEAEGINWIDQTIYVRPDESEPGINVRISDEQLEKLYVSMLARKYPHTARAAALGAMP
jgi:hypothetical protein